MGARRRAAAALVALLLVAGGCTDLAQFGVQRAGDDRLGWEDGYWYDESLAVDQSNGLNESERRVVVARTMARVERIRGLEFEERVPVEVITREEYRQRRADRGSRGEAFGAWNNQVWEALFLVGEDRNVSEVFDDVFGASVTGFYSPARDEIVIVSDTETPRIDRVTLAHELVHALQDQHHSLGTSPDTQDAQLAENGLVEGDANAVQRVYEDRCAESWDCLPRPDRVGGDGSFDEGVFLAVFTPYAEGPRFVAALRERGGWAAVDDAYDRFPASTEQVIHPERYPDDRPANVTVPDRSAAAWERFDLNPKADTVGEASVYAMFWANGQVAREGGARFDYDHPLSAGWAGDAVVPYRNGDDYGYVWTSKWDSPGEAREFLDGYRALLDSRGAREVGDGVYVVDDGPFADAFRVTRRGDTVVVVNAPGRDGLDAVHAPR
jgi:hypothetical protein